MASAEVTRRSTRRSEAGNGSEPESNDSNQIVNSEDATPSVDSQQRPQPAGPTFFARLKSMMINMMIFWLISRYFFGQKAARAPTATDPSKGPAHAPSPNLFGKGFPMDMYVYVSEDSYEPDFFSAKELKWVQKGLIFDDWSQGSNYDSTFSSEIDVDLSPKVQRNGSIWLHTYFVRSGNIPFEQSRTAENYSPIYTVHKKKQLNRYKRRQYRDTHNLITGRTDKSLEEQEKIKNKVKEEIISHWHPNMTINMIYDHSAWPQGAVPAPLDEFIEFEPTTGKYYPIVYINDYWNLMRDYQPINETVKSIQMRLTFHPLSMMKWQLYAAQGMRNKWSKMLGTDALENEDEQDYIKEALLETSPILLGATIVVSIAHSVFEFLAFKNDIQFWKDRKSLEGLSVRSVFFNLFQSVVVLLYVLDNDTNTLIRISIGIGLLIELWKIPKVVHVKLDREDKILGIIPRLRFEDKGSYVESSTKQYDMMAYKYLSWLVFPLFVGYAIYSLIYQEHKGWYSFVLNMTYGFLLAFGFIMMTPQLFINYKLKSVAHLPWRMLTYKFLNTFIDDIFAFVIKMPMMYRIGCFRDDIIFLIYLYQRWIYRVDPKRVNEFGISGEQLQDGATQSTSADQTSSQSDQASNKNKAVRRTE